MMINLKHNIYNVKTALLIGLTLYSCQYNLHVTGEEEGTAQSGVLTSSCLKRPYDALTHETEEGNKVPVITQEESQNSSTTPLSAENIVTTDRTAPVADIEVPISTISVIRSFNGSLDVLGRKYENGKKTFTKAEKEEHKDQKSSEGLKRWFKEFVEAVDDEAVLYQGETSRALPALIQEGKKKGYLTKSSKLVISGLDWEPICTPLHYAAAKGNSQAVEILLNESVVEIDAQTADSGTTPLQFAAYGGYPEVVKLFVSAYKKNRKLEKIDSPDNEGTSTLQYASSGVQEDMNREVAELLVEAGASLDQLMEKEIPLMSIAAMVGNSAMVEYYLEKVFGQKDEEAIIRNAIRQAKRAEHAHIVVMLQRRYGALTEL